MQTGTVKWFNETRGFGFVSPTDGGRGVFVHFSSIQKDGLKTLVESHAVEFEAKADQKAPKRQSAFLSKLVSNSPKRSRT